MLNLMGKSAFQVATLFFQLRPHARHASNLRANFLLSHLWNCGGRFILRNVMSTLDVHNWEGSWSFNPHSIPVCGPSIQCLCAKISWSSIREPRSGLVKQNYLRSGLHFPMHQINLNKRENLIGL